MTDRDRSRHPDARLLAQMAAALCWWAEQPCTRPTSSLAGTGAVAAAEKGLAGFVPGCVGALAFPSATSGLRVALQACGVREGDPVLVPALDWTAAAQAVRSLGGRPVIVDVDDATLTMSPGDAAARRTTRTAAVVVTDLNGVPADVRAIRRAVPGIPVVEDCAQALGASIDGHPVGAWADVAVFSGKALGVPSIGFLVSTDAEVFDRAIALSQHPIRQLLHGFPEPNPHVLVTRVSEPSALLAAHALSQWGEQAARRRACEKALHAALIGLADARPLLDDRRLAEPGTMPVLWPPKGGEDLPRQVEFRQSGCVVLPGLGLPRERHLLAVSERAGVLVARRDDDPALPVVP